MENSWSLFNNSSSSTRGQNGHYSNLAWDIWELGTSRFDWSTTAAAATTTTTTNNSFHQQEPPSSATATTEATTAYPEASAVHALMLGHSAHQTAASLYAGAGPHYHPDPHLTCLKLGKRHYFEDANAAALADRHHVGGISIAKRGKPYYYYGGGGAGGVGVAGTSTSAAVTVASPPAVPRCQVDGCHVALVNAKDYHRRHKVCEMHSKAPKVAVLGLEQRFCQQCSRFHEVSEFDDSKRSCRRRLAGHNERRRKGSHDSIARNHPSHSQDDKLMAESFSYLTLPTGRAHSLLSSSKNNSWFSSADLSSRCSAALRELIAENRAAILARQLVLDRDWHRGSHHHTMEDENVAQLAGTTSLSTSHHHQMFSEPHGWDRFNEEGSGHVTLDLMQAPSSAFGFLSVRGKSKEEEEECSGLWTHIV